MFLQARTIVVGFKVKTGIQLKLCWHEEIFTAAGRKSDLEICTTLTLTN